MELSSLLSFFPTEYYKVRPVQRKALEFIEKSVNAGKRNIIVQASTGTGKSPIAVAVCRWLGDGYILTANKMLQDQYLKEFPELQEAKGRANFTCLTSVKLHNENKEKISIKTCAEGICAENEDFECDYKATIFGENTAVQDEDVIAESHRRGPLRWASETPKKCAYWRSKITALNTETVIHNYNYVLTETNYVGDFGPRNVMVLDEAHDIESKLTDFLSVDITQAALDKINEYRDKEQPVSFVWINKNETEAKKYVMYLDNIRHILAAVEELKMKTVCINTEDQKTFNNLINKLEVIIEEAKDRSQWVVIEKRDNEDKVKCVSFKPVFVHKYAEKYLLHLGKVNVFLSATILDAERFAKSLGLKDYVYLELDPVFLQESNRIIQLNIADMVHSDEDTDEDVKEFFRGITAKIDDIVDMHPNVKGIVHCNSYKIAEIMKEFTRNKDRMLIPSVDEREEAIQYHIDITNRYKATVLCSPAIIEGVDLKDDLSRFQIFVKIPYPNPTEPQVKKRLLMDRKYCEYKAAVAMIQGLGRSVRNEKDWCVTYTLDSRFDAFCKRNRNITRLFTRHFVLLETVEAIMPKKLLRPIARKHAKIKTAAAKPV